MGERAAASQVTRTDKALVGRKANGKPMANPEVPTPFLYSLVDNGVGGWVENNERSV